MTQAEYIEKIRKNIKSSSNELDDNDLITALNNALSQLSRDVPLIKTINYVSDGELKFNLPADWDEGYSYIQCVESVDTDTSEYLEKGDYKISYEGSIPYLEITKDFMNGKILILYYSVPYKIIDTENNVKGSLSLALLWLSCSLVILILSQKYSYLQDSDGNPEIKIINRSVSLLEISKKYKLMYDDLIMKIIFGPANTRAYFSTRNHDSDVFGNNKMFH